MTSNLFSRTAVNVERFPFPLDTLPPKLRRFVEEAADSIGIDPDFIAALVLATTSGAIVQNYEIRLKQDFIERAAIWMILVGKSGVGKTPAVKTTTAPFLAYQRYLDDQYNEAISAHDQAMEDCSQEQPIRKPMPSAPEQILLDNVTPEALVEILSNKPRSCLVLQDELSSIFMSRHGRNSLLSIFSGIPIRQNRKTGQKLTVVHEPAMAFGGGIQPAVLQQELSRNKNLILSGFLPRFLFVMPPDKPVVWTEMEISHEAKDDYHRLIKTLLERCECDDCTPGKPFVVVLSDSAKQVWQEFRRANTVEESEIGFEEGRAMLAKIPTHVARMALLLHVVEHTELGNSVPPEVSDQTLSSALRLTEWFRNESMRVLVELLGMGSRASDPQATAIFDMIGKNGDVCKADLHNSRAFRSLHKPAEAIDAKLSELLALGQLESRYVKHKDGGRGMEVFYLPTTDSDSGTPENTEKNEGSTATVKTNLCMDDDPSEFTKEDEEAVWDYLSTDGHCYATVKDVSEVLKMPYQKTIAILRNLNAENRVVSGRVSRKKYYVAPQSTDVCLEELN